MSAKYYTHFIAQSEDAIEYSEYRGVVELLDQSAKLRGNRDIVTRDQRRALPSQFNQRLVEAKDRSGIRFQIGHVFVDEIVW